MTSKISIYLAGSIKKSHETHHSFWTEDNIDFLRKQLQPVEVSFLNPALRSDDLSDEKSVFGRDMLQVFCSDIVFVDARDRRGLGVGAEMMWAKMNRIPIVTWAPKNSHYHMESANVLGISVDKYVHPFVEGLSDKIVEDLAEGVACILDLISAPKHSIKGKSDIETAMKYYQETQLLNDTAMFQLAEKNPILRSRMESVR